MHDVVETALATEFPILGRLRASNAKPSREGGRGTPSLNPVPPHFTYRTRFRDTCTVGPGVALNVADYDTYIYIYRHAYVMDKKSIELPNVQTRVASRGR